MPDMQAMLCSVLVIYYDIVDDTSEAWEPCERLVHVTVVMLGY